MAFELDEFHRNTPDLVFVSDLKTVAATLGKASVTRAEYDSSGRFNSSTIVRRFGSWQHALELAELHQTRTPMNLTEAELFQNLEQVWSRLGRQPRYSEMSKPLSMYSVGTYEKRFGGWRKALNLFVDFMEGTGVSVVNSTPTQDQRGVTARSHRTSRSINWRLRFIVLRRDNFKCVACGRSPATDPSIILQPDHMKPWAKGGETTLDNLQTLCSVCNIGKSDMHD